MSNILLAWTNRADSATVSAGAALTTQAASNVQIPHLTRRWHTPAGVNASWLLLDLGAPLACDVVSLQGTNLTPAAGTRLRASNLDPTAQADLLLDDNSTGVAIIKSGYGSVYRAFASTSARYWRLDVSDQSLDHLEIGRVVLAPSWLPSSNLLYGWNVTPQDPSRLGRSGGGQLWADVLPQQRLLQFTLSFMNEAEMYGNAFALARAAGIVRDVLAVRDIASPFVNEQSVWGTLQASQPLVNEKLHIFTQKFLIEERL